MKRVETKYSGRSAGHYSPGIVHDGLLYVSGQLSVDPETGEAWLRRRDRRWRTCLLSSRRQVR